jgi:hypothetical protein
LGFLSPWFLGGLLAVGIPLYVHLLKQHKSNPLPFSSLMFFEKRTQSSVKHRRLKYIALLVMRCLLILLIALLFAKPYVRKTMTGDAQGRKMLLVAVDNSFSMRAGSRLEDAKNAALGILSQFRPGDRGQVISFASTAQLLTQPVTSGPELEAAVRSIQAGDGRSAYAEIARVIRSLSPPDDMPVEAHVFTDGQKSSMPTPFSELAVPPGTKLTVHSVADRSEPNWFVEAVHAPRSVYQPKKVRIQAVVAGSGTEAAETNVSLLLNGKSLESKRVKLEPGGRATVEFYLPDAAYGMNRGEVRIDASDKLAADNVYPFSIERKEARRILLIHEPNRTRALEYYRAALESTPDAGFTVDAAPSNQVDNLDFNKYAFVVLTDSAAPVEDYLKRGGGVLVAAGSNMAARGEFLGTRMQETRYASRDNERFYAAGDVDASHPAVARTEKFDDVKFYQIVRLEPGKNRVVARLTDGTPLLMERSVGSGRLLIFASTFDNIANDLPLHASFVPFVEQSALYLSGAEAAPAQFAVDSFVDLKGGGEIIGPDGQRALSLAEAAKTPAFRLAREGFWEVRRPNGRHELIAVHADRRESELAVVPKETLALWQSTGKPEVAGGSGESNERPYGIWWYVLLALLVAAVAESLFAGKYLNPEQAQPIAQKRAA